LKIKQSPREKVTAATRELEKRKYFQQQLFRGPAES
jgi:hypothetical protein